jgi:hypothetical protein
MQSAKNRPANISSRKEASDRISANILYDENNKTLGKNQNNENPID